MTAAIAILVIWMIGSVFVITHQATRIGDLQRRIRTLQQWDQMILEALKGAGHERGNTEAASRESV